MGHCDHSGHFPVENRIPCGKPCENTSQRLDYAGNLDVDQAVHSAVQARLTVGRTRDLIGRHHICALSILRPRRPSARVAISDRAPTEPPKGATVRASDADRTAASGRAGRPTACVFHASNLGAERARLIRSNLPLPPRPRSRTPRTTARTGALGRSPPATHRSRARDARPESAPVRH